MRALLCVLFCFSTNQVSAQENWPQFRGADSRGVAQNANLPSEWSETENILWKSELPGRGWSSPVVWGNRVFLTTVVNSGTSEEPRKGLYFGGNRPKPPTSEHEWKVYCLDLETGNTLWQKTVKKQVPESGLHIKNSYASETPITDGKHLYVYFGNVGIFCFSLDGNEVWSKPLEAQPTRYGWGTASSPVLHEDRLYLVNDNDEQSYLLALNKNTGEEVWRTDRDEKSNWATPYIWKNKLRTEIITPGTGKFRSYDLEGKLLYEFGGASSITIATPYSEFGMLYVSSGYVGDRKRPLFAIKPGASGDISLSKEETANEHIAWCQKQGAPYNPSTIVYNDLLYVLHDRGYITCYEAKTGKQVYDRQRLRNGRAFTSSPWAYDGKLFCLNEYGETFVVQAGREFKVLHSNKLGDGEMCMATPAIAGDKLLIRTEDRIYCVQQSAEEVSESDCDDTATVQEETKPEEDKKPLVGRIQNRTYDFKEAEQQMGYTLYVPKAYDKSKAFPLVVALHGLGSNPNQIIRYPGLVQQAEKHGYIVVAPMGYNSRGWYGSRGKGGGRGDDPDNLGELSEKDVMNVLAITRKEFNIDNNRIYLMGHSMGGGGTWHLGLKHPDLWAALAPIAPAISSRVHKPDDLMKIVHMPVIVVQGDQDRLVPVRLARVWVAKMKELKMTYKYIEVEGGGHVKVAFDNMPKIFEFFNNHQKKPNGDGAEE